MPTIFAPDELEELEQALLGLHIVTDTFTVFPTAAGATSAIYRNDRLKPITIRAIANDFTGLGDTLSFDIDGGHGTAAEVISQGSPSQQYLLRPRSVVNVVDNTGTASLTLCLTDPVSLLQAIEQMGMTPDSREAAVLLAILSAQQIFTDQVLFTSLVGSAGVLVYQNRGTNPVIVTLHNTDALATGGSIIMDIDGSHGSFAEYVATNDISNRYLLRPGSRLNAYLSSTDPNYTNGDGVNGPTGTVLIHDPIHTLRLLHDAGI